MKKRILALVLLTALLTAVGAQATTPYRTFTLGVNKDLVETQTAYEPVRSMIRFGEETLNSPSDLRMGKDGNLYIADTGNKRILIVSREGELIKEIKDKKNFKTPSGVNVDEEGNIYVADESARAVLVYDPEGNLIRTWEKPTHPLFGETAPYKPRKVVIDKRGNLYISSKGNTNGIVQLSPAGDGEFLGYYGANTSSVSFITAIRKAIFTDEQLSGMAGIVPISVENLCIDDRGMVYAVSQTNDDRSLRRLNVAGRNTLVPDYWTELTTAVAVTDSGSVFTANANGRIVEYTSEGDMLFVFGAFDNGDQRIGTFKSVTGLVVDENYRLYVLDSVLGSIQVLEPTEFTSLVHNAFTLFQDGKYEESKQPWSQVQRMNSLFTYANTGMGEALYREGGLAAQPRRGDPDRAGGRGDPVAGTEAAEPEDRGAAAGGPGHRQGGPGENPEPDGLLLPHAEESLRLLLRHQAGKPGGMAERRDRAGDRVHPQRNQQVLQRIPLQDGAGRPV